MAGTGTTCLTCWTCRIDGYYTGWFGGHPPVEGRHHSRRRSWDWSPVGRSMIRPRNCSPTHWAGILVRCPRIPVRRRNWFPPDSRRHWRIRNLNRDLRGFLQHCSARTPEADWTAGTDWLAADCLRHRTRLADSVGMTLAAAAFGQGRSSNRGAAARSIAVAAAVGLRTSFGPSAPAPVRASSWSNRLHAHYQSGAALCAECWCWRLGRGFKARANIT